MLGSSSLYRVYRGGSSPRGHFFISHLFSHDQRSGTDTVMGALRLEGCCDLRRNGCCSGDSFRHRHRQAKDGKYVQEYVWEMKVGEMEVVETRLRNKLAYAGGY